MISISHIHPMLVHFPIALVVIGFAAEVFSFLCKKEVCLSKTGFYLLITGTLSAGFALLSGILFTAELAGSAGEIQETHELFAWVSISLLVLTSILRLYMKIKNEQTSQLKWISFALYALAAVSVSITGYYGGTLVYSYMMPL